MNSPHIWAELSLHHPYFGQNTPQDLLTSSQLPQGLFWQARKEDIFLYSRQASDVVFPLLIPLQVSDRNFTVYTQLPDEFYAPQVTSHVWVIEGNKGKEEVEIDTMECRYVPLYPSRFSYPLPKGKKLKSVCIKASDGSEKQLSIPLANQQPSLAIDLSDFHPGLFDAKFTFTDESEHTHAFLAADNLYMRPPFAVWLQQLPDFAFAEVLEETDLEIFEGIGAKEAKALVKAELKTWELIHSSSGEDLGPILERDPQDRKVTRLLDQAKLATEGKWEDLAKLQRTYYPETPFTGPQGVPVKLLTEAQRISRSRPPKKTNRRLSNGYVIPRFSLNFTPQYTYWRYLITGLKDSDWAEVRVEVNGENVPEGLTFEKEEKAISLPNGLEAYAMRSSKPLSFQQLPDAKISLYAPSFPGEIRLPYSQPNQLKKMNESAPPTEMAVAYVSEIFVHL